ncbi:primase-associated protein [Haladaptatus pallidirubidus]|uniref:Primase-associated protein n=1 Tax=Haladaptatus pallidirubidus TaxID=1008152 RepID=A0AAV3UI55_9EURY|nr:primase-associated protein [Haladaptatus pallidirubidus]
MSQKTPLNDEYMAYRVAALPRGEGQVQLTQLFERGYQRWTVDDTQETEKLLADIERFTFDAFVPSTRRKAAERPYVDDPGMLAVLATLGAVCIMDHPKLEETPPRHLALLDDLRELYVNNIASLIREYDDFTLHQEIAEILYAKESGEGGPHSGRVCTDITTRPEFSGGYYLEIPLVAASRKCLARTDRDGDQQGEIQTHVADNHLYAPVSDFMQKYRSYAEDAFSRLLAAQEEALTPKQRSWLTANESAITERIDRFFAAGQTHRIWRNWSRQKQRLRTIINAVHAVDDDVAQLGQTHTARELYAALEAYDPERSWEQHVCDSISTPRSLGTILSTNRDYPSVTVENDRLNRYTLTQYSDGAQAIHVDDLEDLFELPCLAAMDERLQEKKPVRKDLYNLVRMAWWLPQYRDASTGEFVNDMKEVFARWSWYDEETTEYQIQYELNNDIGGEIPLPMNCSNDDMQRYCIGCDQCPYSIYGSLPFPDEMYDLLEERSETSLI